MANPVMIYRSPHHPSEVAAFLKEELTLTVRIPSTMTIQPTDIAESRLSSHIQITMVRYLGGATYTSSSIQAIPIDPSGVEGQIQ